jgi:hypothetical protein
VPGKRANPDTSGSLHSDGVLPGRRAAHGLFAPVRGARDETLQDLAHGPGSVFTLPRSPDGNGSVLLQIDKDSGQPRAYVDLGKEREPVYAVDPVAGLLFLRTAPATLIGYRL